MTFTRLFLICSIMLLAGCESPDYVKVPRLPAWEETGVSYSADEVMRYTAQVAGVVPQLSDRTYTPMTDAWVDKMLTWTWHFSHATHIEYTPESFDCDKFAKAVSLAAEVACARAGVLQQPIVARVYVHQRKAWGGIGAGGKHALNAVFTETGVWIIEPQTRRKTPLEHYPNKNGIYAIKIGG